MNRATLFYFVVMLAIGASAAVGQKPDALVAPDGSGTFLTVQAAIDHVPENNPKRFVIALKAGTYNEQVRVPANKPFISIVGNDPAKTVITFKLSAKDASSTSASYAAYIGGHDFHAENITIENSFGVGSQAVAALVEADRAVFKNCRFIGWQDTLYAKGGRQYYENCYIEGSVDFIFGQAAAFFENCEIHSKADGYIAAPMRFAADEPSGFVFHKCRLTASDTRSGVYLGRPWRDYGRTVFLETQMDGHIRPEGWNHWLPEREKTAYFAEFASTGKGANDAARAKWSHQLSAAEAKAFSAETFLKGVDGWNPATAKDEWLTANKPDWKLITWSEALKQKPLWYQTDEAARIADQLLIYQKVNGGFEKNIDMALMLSKAEREALAAKRDDISETTIDNRTTYPQAEYLAKVITASMLKPSPPSNLPKYKEAFERTVDYLLSSQYENGGFPQFFPLKKGYYTHITLNDDAMIGVMNFFRDIVRKEEDYKFVDETRRSKTEKALDKAVALILKLQVEIGGKKTVWAQQYDEVTLKPAWARKFEPPCLTAGESVNVVRFLMKEKPTPEITAAIESAIAWYKTTQINGIRFESVKGDRKVIPDKAAEPLWARFYEFETMKPIFMGRDSIVRYDVAEIEAERRNGYAWYTSAPNSLLGTNLEKWHRSLLKAH